MFGSRKEDTADDFTKRLDALGKMLETTTKQVGALAQQNQRLNSMLTAQMARDAGGPTNGSGKGDGHSAQAPALDTSGLPDPVNDPDGFSTALVARLSSFQQAQTKASDDAKAGASKVQEEAAAFWTGVSNDFDTTYKDLNDQDEAVKAAAEKVIAQWQAAGMSEPEIRRAVALDRDTFMQRIAENARVSVQASGKKKAHQPKQRGEQQQAADGELPQPIAADLSHGHQLGGGEHDHTGDVTNEADPDSDDGLPDSLRTQVMGGDAFGGAAGGGKTKQAPKSLQQTLVEEQKRVRLL